MKVLRGIGISLLTFIGTALTLTLASDGYITINGKRFYFSTSALANADASTVPAGGFVFTTHATGRGQIFVSDGSNLFDITTMVSIFNLATIATSAGTTSSYSSAPFAGVLIGAFFTGIDALAANNTNYVTFALTNISNSNAAMLAASDANTSKATGGSALSANTKRELTLHGTAGNKVVAQGDRLKFDVVATGTLANTITVPTVMLVFRRTV